MNGWTLTKVWQVDHKLVVANTINEAVELFKAYMENNDEPSEVKSIGTSNALCDHNALIKEAEKDLALTWEDIGTIDDIIEQLANHSDLPLQGQEVFYQEVLRRFRETKNK